MSVNSTSGTSSANMLRITGMASGIDTDATVKAMVSSYQLKVDKADQAKQTLQWKQEIYRDIIKDIKGLQDYFDPISSKYILSQKTFNTNTATNTETSVFSGTPSASAKTGNYKVKVLQLAEKAKIESDSKSSIIEVTNSAKWNGKTIDFGTKGKIDLETIAGDSNENGSITDEIVANINKQIASSDKLKGKITASYVKNGSGEYIKFTNLSSESITINKYVADPASITTVTDITANTSINNGITSTSKLTDFGFSSGNTVDFDLTYGSSATAVPISLTINSSSTLQDLMDKVNTETEGSVTLSIDEATGKLSFQSKEYGSSTGISISNNSSTENLGFKVYSGEGKDALVEITAPGESAVTTTQSSNEFTADGVTYNLLGKGESTLTVSSNTDTVVSNIKKFIEDYNSLITKINTKLTEKKNKDYVPLTDAQKESMSEDQIKAWEAKAKVGILRNDGYLQNLMTQLRGSFYSPVYSSYDSNNADTGKISLNFGTYGSGAVGIETSTDYTDGGLIVVKDETKLKEAIQNNIEDFKKLFIGKSTSTLETNENYVGSKKYNEDGIFKRIDNIIRDYVAAPGLGKDGTYSLSGYMNIFVNKQYDFSNSGSASKNTLPDQIYAKLLSVSKFEDQLTAAETRYYNQFAQLEKAMNTMNSQMSYLSSQLGTSS